MNIETYRDFCLSFKGVEEGMPFDNNTLVFKVMGKMFTIADMKEFKSINVKCNPEKALELREKYEGVIPGYHMSKKHWNTIKMDGSIPDPIIKDWIIDSYHLVVAGLPKKIREALSA